MHTRIHMRIICICSTYNAQHILNNHLNLEKKVKLHTLTKGALVGAISFALAQPALAITDEEFKTLQEQFNQLADQVEDNSKNSTSDTSVG